MEKVTTKALFFQIICLFVSQTPSSTIQMEHSPELHYFWSMVINIQRQGGRGLRG